MSIKPSQKKRHDQNFSYDMENLNAVKCNFNRVNNKEHQHSLEVSSFLKMHMRHNSMCSLFEVFLGVL